MGKISTYSVLSTPAVNDKLIGTDVTPNNETKNFLISSLLQLLPSVVLTLPIYASNAAALAGGLVIGNLYRSAAGVVSIVF
jgi:hypothetical protein